MAVLVAAAFTCARPHSFVLLQFYYSNIFHKIVNSSNNTLLHDTTSVNLVIAKTYTNRAITHRLFVLALSA